MSENSYHVNLENFRGPLGLLLELIEKHKLDICDVSLAKVTEDYLEYVRSASLDQYNANIFLDIAARLILVKSRALLPSTEVDRPIEDEEDITSQLLTLAKFQKAAKAISSNNQLLQRPSFKLQAVDRPLYKIKLIKMKQIFQNLKQDSNINPSKSYRLKRRYDRELKSKLASKLVSLKSISLDNINTISNNRTESVTLFLLILEFVRSNKANIDYRQNKITVEFN